MLLELGHGAQKTKGIESFHNSSIIYLNKVLIPGSSDVDCRIVMEPKEPRA